MHVVFALIKRTAIVDIVPLRGEGKEFANNSSSMGVPCRKIKYHLEESMNQIYRYYGREGD